jgi:predicted TPR repeat methyltransferase
VRLISGKEYGTSRDACAFGRSKRKRHSTLGKAFKSSGDLVADRRAEYAKMLAEGGDFAAASDLMVQTLELAPDWAAGWDLLGTYYEKIGDISGAISAWRHLEALDDEGTFGAELKLAAHGAGAARDGTAVSYVEALFDQYASKFEQSLVGKLSYRVPDMLDTLVNEEMQRLRISRFSSAIDLGCGTGLMGVHLRDKVDQLEGIDISAAMIAETARKGIYDKLEKAELVAALNQRNADTDLLTAADVLIYCGAVEPVLAAMVPALRPGGLVAFSLEAHDGPEAVFLRPSLRYAHGIEATRDALVQAGLVILRYELAALRMDRGEPITGILVVAQKPILAMLASNDDTLDDGVAA